MNKLVLLHKFLFTSLLIGFFLHFVNFSKGFASDPKMEAKRGIVKIIAQKPGDLQETGAGIIISVRNHRIYVLTAFHVIDEAQKINVKFYEYPTEEFAGRAFRKFDQEKDLAVILVDTKIKLKKINILKLGDIAAVNELDKVIALGHPGQSEWEFSSAEIRVKEPSQLRFSGNAVDPGNSGGALLDKDFLLIGIVTQKQVRHGIALKIKDAIEVLKSWKIPCELKHPKKLWPWIAGGSVAIVTIGIIIWKQKDDENNGQIPMAPGRPN